MGSKETMNFPTNNFLRFQLRDMKDLKNLNYKSFCKLFVNSAQCVFGTKKHLDSGILLNYDDDKYSQEYGQIKEVFRSLTKDDILQLYISDHDSRSSNIRADDVGYFLFVFDIQYCQNFTSSEPIEVEFKFDGVVTNDILMFML